MFGQSLIDDAEHQQHDHSHASQQHQPRQPVPCRRIAPSCRAGIAAQQTAHAAQHRRRQQVNDVAHVDTAHAEVQPCHRHRQQETQRKYRTLLAQCHTL